MKSAARILRRLSRRGALCGGFVLAILAFHSISAVAQSEQASISEVADGEQLYPAEFPTTAPASSPATILDTASLCGFRNLPQCLKDIGNDQLGIWTSPTHLKMKDSLWIAPFLAATAVAFSTDAHVSQDVGFNRTTLKVSADVSNFGSGYALVGIGGALWSIGTFTHHQRVAETGRLGLEAIADAFLVDEAIKLATNRERPYQDLVERGQFWVHGVRGMTDSSFPSGHTISTWALARVVAEEYPNKWVKLGAYSFATAISLSRIGAQDHFPSDVLVGGVFGYLIGGYVVHHRESGRAAFISSIEPVMNSATRTYGIGLQIRP